MSIIGYDKFGRPVLNGGKGSGNFGHSGRPGLQGGSAGAGSAKGSKATVSKKELSKESTASIKQMHKGVSKSIQETEEQIASLKEKLKSGTLADNWKVHAEERVKKLEDQLEKEKADKEVYEEALKEREGDSKDSKSAKDLYKEKYEKDYQGDEIPDKPIDKITDKDIEHLDTQVRERLMKEKRKATGKQTHADAEEAYYDKIDKTDYHDLDDTLYGLEDPASDELRYSLLSLTSQYSAVLHGEVRPSDVKEYEKGIKEAIKDSEKYADQLEDKDLKKRAKELIDYIKDAPTRFEEDNSLLDQRLNNLVKAVNGGKGSGNFGHSGRPGLQGGSAGAGSSSSPKAKSFDDELKKKR